MWTSERVYQLIYKLTTIYTTLNGLSTIFLFFLIDSRVRFKVGKFAFLEKKPQVKSQFFKSDELFFSGITGFFLFR